MESIQLYSPKKITYIHVLLRTVFCFWEKTTIELGMHHFEDGQIISRVNFINTWTKRNTNFDALIDSKTGDLIQSDTYQNLQNEILHQLWPIAKSIHFKNLIDQRINPQGRPVCTLRKLETIAQ